MTLEHVVTGLIVGTGASYVAAVLLLIVFLIRAPLRDD